MTALEERDPLYHFSTHYPDRFSLLDPVLPPKTLDAKTARQSRIARRKNNPRYKTQPITFDEIKEVEEPATPSDENEPGNNNNNTSCFLAKFQESGGKSDNRLHPHKFEIKPDNIRSDATVTDHFYDSPFPSKLSFLDEHHPALQHHKPVMTSLKQGSKADKFSLKSRIARRRNNPRYKTQPITFDEIKEVEEPDNGNNNESDSNTNTVSALLSKNTTADVNTVQCAYVH